MAPPFPHPSWTSPSGVATGRMGGSGPPTSVQTPPEICANPLRSVFCIGGGGPMHVYCNFLMLTSKQHFLDPLTFLGLATPLTSHHRISPSPPTSHPVRCATRRSTYIKQMPLDTRSRDCDIEARRRRDPAGPRIADDSNSQNVNSRLFPVKSVSQTQITVIIMLTLVQLSYFN